MTLFSSWYRLWASTRLKSFSCQRWIDTWWPEQAVGGKKGREIYEALFPLTEKVTQGQFVVSLDFSLAFDYSHPDLVVSFFRDLGMPETICNILSVQWTNQQRYLSFENFVLPNPELVNSSLPQGDPWSMLGMVALLTPAMWEIARRYPTDRLLLVQCKKSWMCKQYGPVGAKTSSCKKTLAKLSIFIPKQGEDNHFWITESLPTKSLTTSLSWAMHVVVSGRENLLMPKMHASTNPLQSFVVLHTFQYL